MMSMDPLRLSVALLPLAMYLLVIARLNLGRAPVIVSGARDTAALGCGLAGLAIVGPVELFMPEAAAREFGPWIWGLLVGMYALLVTLAMTGQRPRLVIYNAPREVVRAAVERVAAELDPTARWAGDTVELPAAQLEMRLEYFSPLQNASLVMQGELYRTESWRTLRLGLEREFARVVGLPNPRGGIILSAGLLLLGLVVWQLISRPQAMALAIPDLLRW